MLESITLDQSEVSAEIDAYIHHVCFGKQGVFEYGEQLRCEIVNNNLLKIYDGLFINQGRFNRIVPGTYEEVKIANGVVDSTRYDLIVSHFETDGINETHDIRVIQGDDEGNIPSLQTGDTFNGATVNELLLYTIKLDGINIESVTKGFDTISQLKKYMSVVSKGDGYVEVEFDTD
ncbi:hypothetical protein DW906_02990 [Coprobacillus sp. AM42-12AC]|jgi:hypothetical protein|nr:hypothetical protein HMPREF0979_00789 [Coprobacillus sp. 8_1_38FAA]RHB06430.1 hypothetical protein DW906_02990 [Coprobacillus sp. AM42-12AC]